MNKNIVILLMISLIVLVGCNTKIETKEISYSQYNQNGFSTLFPQWTDDTQGDVELTVTEGYCTLSINSEKIPAKQWYDMFEESVTQQSGNILILDENDLRLKYSLNYQGHNLISDNRIYECNENSIVVTLTCLEGFEEIMQKVSNNVFPSANCQGEEIKYQEQKDGDFSITYPDWEETINGEEQRIVGVTKGVCSVIVDKHNALPSDVFNWISTSIEDKSDHDMLTSYTEGDEYYFSYRFPYEENVLTATTKISYCNYQSYVTQVICVDEYTTEEDEGIRGTVLESSTCSKEYEVPTPEVIEEEREEVEEEEPEVIEEIEDEIVKTNAGEEFGIDEEMVVYFINGNTFFTNIMKDFPKANIVIEDEENSRELKLRILIDGNGKIILLEDGEYNDEDVTLIVPLNDALNIFSNAANLNPLNLLAFAINVRTEPVEIKNQVIQKVLQGEYN